MEPSTTGPSSGGRRSLKQRDGVNFDNRRAAHVVPHLDAALVAKVSLIQRTFRSFLDVRAAKHILGQKRAAKQCHEALHAVLGQKGGEEGSNCIKCHSSKVSFSCRQCDDAVYCTHCCIVTHTIDTNVNDGRSHNMVTYDAAEGKYVTLHRLDNGVESDDNSLINHRPRPLQHMRDRVRQGGEARTCGNCEHHAASVFCHYCEEFMCRSCNHDFHHKKSKRGHVRTSVRVHAPVAEPETFGDADDDLHVDDICANCEEDRSTKRCLDCEVCYCASCDEGLHADSAWRYHSRVPYPHEDSEDEQQDEAVEEQNEAMEQQNEAAEEAVAVTSQRETEAAREIQVQYRYYAKKKKRRTNWKVSSEEAELSSPIETKLLVSPTASATQNPSPSPRSKLKKRNGLNYDDRRASYVVPHFDESIVAKVVLVQRAFRKFVAISKAKHVAHQKRATRASQAALQQQLLANKAASEAGSKCYKCRTSKVNFTCRQCDDAVYCTHCCLAVHGHGEVSPAYTMVTYDANSGEYLTLQTQTLDAPTSLGQDHEHALWAHRPRALQHMHDRVQDAGEGRMCGNCEHFPASVFCHYCEDFMCSSCNHAFHNKKNKRGHVRSPLKGVAISLVELEDELQAYSPVDEFPDPDAVCANCELEPSEQRCIDCQRCYCATCDAGLHEDQTEHIRQPFFFESEDEEDEMDEVESEFEDQDLVDDTAQVVVEEDALLEAEEEIQRRLAEVVYDDEPIEYAPAALAISIVTDKGMERPLDILIANKEAEEAEIYQAIDQKQFQFYDPERQIRAARTIQIQYRYYEKKKARRELLARKNAAAQEIQVQYRYHAKKKRRAEQQRALDGKVVHDEVIAVTAQEEEEEEEESTAPPTMMFAISVDPSPNSAQEAVLDPVNQEFMKQNAQIMKSQELIFAIGDTVKTPQGPGTVTSLRDADKMYAVTLEWKLAYDNVVVSYIAADVLEALNAATFEAKEDDLALQNAAAQSIQIGYRYHAKKKKRRKRLADEAEAKEANAAAQSIQVQYRYYAKKKKRRRASISEGVSVAEDAQNAAAQSIQVGYRYHAKKKKRRRVQEAKTRRQNEAAQSIQVGYRYHAKKKRRRQNMAENENVNNVSVDAMAIGMNDVILSDNGMDEATAAQNIQVQYRYYSSKKRRKEQKRIEAAEAAARNLAVANEKENEEGKELVANALDRAAQDRAAQEIQVQYRYHLRKQARLRALEEEADEDKADDEDDALGLEIENDPLLQEQPSPRDVLKENDNYVESNTPIVDAQRMKYARKHAQHKSEAGPRVHLSKGFVSHGRPPAVSAAEQADLALNLAQDGMANFEAAEKEEITDQFFPGQGKKIVEQGRHHPNDAVWKGNNYLQNRANIHDSASAREAAEAQTQFHDELRLGDEPESAHTKETTIAQAPAVAEQQARRRVLGSRLHPRAKNIKRTNNGIAYELPRRTRNTEVKVGNKKTGRKKAPALGLKAASAHINPRGSSRPQRVIPTYIPGQTPPESPRELNRPTRNNESIFYTDDRPAPVTRSFKKADPPHFIRQKQARMQQQKTAQREVHMSLYRESTPLTANTARANFQAYPVQQHEFEIPDAMTGGLLSARQLQASGRVSRASPRKPKVAKAPVHAARVNASKSREARTQNRLDQRQVSNELPRHPPRIDMNAVF